MNVQNMIFYDFETINDYDFTSKTFQNLPQDRKRKIIAQHTLPIEFSFLIFNQGKLKAKQLKIKYPYTFEDSTENQKKGLIFNKINNQEQLDEHNENAHEIHKVVNAFKSVIFREFDTFDFTLIGYNNFLFDDIILNHYLNMYVPQYTFNILNQSFDLLDFIRYMSHNLDLPFEVRSKFKYVQNYDKQSNMLLSPNSLLNAFMNVFGHEFNAHDSLEDVRALYKLFMYYYENYSIEFQKRHFISTTQIDIYESNFQDANKVIYN